MVLGGHQVGADLHGLADAGHGFLLQIVGDLGLGRCRAGRRGDHQDGRKRNVSASHGMGSAMEFVDRLLADDCERSGYEVPVGRHGGGSRSETRSQRGIQSSPHLFLIPALFHRGTVVPEHVVRRRVVFMRPQHRRLALGNDSAPEQSALYVVPAKRDLSRRV